MVRYNCSLCPSKVGDSRRQKIRRGPFSLEEEEEEPEKKKMEVVEVLVLWIRRWGNSGVDAGPPGCAGAGAGCRSEEKKTRDSCSISLRMSGKEREGEKNGVTKTCSRRESGGCKKSPVLGTKLKNPPRSVTQRARVWSSANQLATRITGTVIIQEHVTHVHVYVYYVSYILRQVDLVFCFSSCELTVHLHTCMPRCVTGTGVSGGMFCMTEDSCQERTK